MATKGNSTNKGLHIRIVLKTMLSRVNLLVLGNRIVDDKKHTTDTIFIFD
ncbi:MAG: hypothetical protein LBC74_00585 [Planctomycetaceae bacterium]|nr:hypothetical protein [Planctomycetaceae bacterium]